MKPRGPIDSHTCGSALSSPWGPSIPPGEVTRAHLPARPLVRALAQAFEIWHSGTPLRGLDGPERPRHPLAGRPRRGAGWVPPRVTRFKEDSRAARVSGHDGWPPYAREALRAVLGGAGRSPRTAALEPDQDPTAH